MWILLYVAIAAAVILADQLSKILVVAFLQEGSLDLIPGVFRFSYVENEGAAFGMLSEHRWIFLVLSTIGIALVALYLYFYAKKPLARTALALIVGGGVGNMIDRLARGFVVDFLDFYAFPNLWKWVFNVADAAVCIGAALFILDLVLELIRELRDKQRQKADGKQADVPNDAAKDGQDESDA